MAEVKGYISVDEALELDRNTVRENYKQYINPGMASLLGLLDFDKRFVRASGVSVWDNEGNEYLDFLGGYGALNTGHNHPRILAALEKVKGMPNILQASLSGMASALAHNLALIAPGNLKRSFFGNSGAEAVEGALKLARASTKKQRIIYCEGSFHGKSFGALSVTGRHKYQAPFGPLLPGTEPVPYGDPRSLEEKLRQKDVAAVILEPIQGEGGVIVPPDDYLKGVRELCTRYDALLILDEIQTGFGRTGRMFACEHEGVAPDIMCVAKSLGGGLMPIGAYMATEKVWDQAYGGIDRALLHTSTFGGNAWASAAGIASLEVILDEDLPGQAREKGEYLLSELRKLQEKHPMIKDVRGRGLLIGIEFEKPAKGVLDKLTGGVVNKLSEEYLGAMVAGELLNRYRVITAYTLNNPNVIRMEPPLTVTRAQIDHVLGALDDIFAKNRGFMSMTLTSTKTAVGALFNRK
ncbi:MAG: aspartate aminotransferase family protein [Firmicutes bacterium]|nr:aspartate aminotransferase family protein [Bacillota bacterium]